MRITVVFDTTPVLNSRAMETFHSLDLTNILEVWEDFCLQSLNPATCSGHI